MAEYTKISFNHRKEISDFSELVEMLFPGNRNQQHAAACILFELKWADNIVPNLVYIENKYSTSRRVLQRARAKLSRLGLIEYVGKFNSRYGGRVGWKLSTRFETAMKRLACKYAILKDNKNSSKEKDSMFIDLANARRNFSPADISPEVSLYESD